MRIIVIPEEPRRSRRGWERLLAGIAVSLQVNAVILVLLHFWIMAGGEPIGVFDFFLATSRAEPPVAAFGLVSADVPEASLADADTLAPTPQPIAAPDVSPLTNHLFELLHWNLAANRRGPTDKAAGGGQSEQFDVSLISRLSAAAIAPSGVTSAGEPSAAPREHGAGQELGAAGGAGDGRQPGGGAPAVEYFGVSARATRIVYVIDASQSMMGAPFARACEELSFSLRRLNPAQSFGVVFFADREPAAMPDGTDLLPATPENLQRLEQWAKRIAPRGGTESDAALLRALAFRPDVVFFLTDGGIPARVLESMRRPPGGTSAGAKTAIHAIGFMSRTGEGTLRRLAEQNHGVYHFVPR